MSCNTWIKNKLVNPRTGKNIKEFGSTYRKIRRRCIVPLKGAKVFLSDLVVGKLQKRIEDGEGVVVNAFTDADIAVFDVFEDASAFEQMGASGGPLMLNIEDFLQFYKYQLDKPCDRWRNYPNINPHTKRRINPDSKKSKATQRLRQECEAAMNVPIKSNSSSIVAPKKKDEVKTEVKKDAKVNKVEQKEVKERKIKKTEKKEKQGQSVKTTGKKVVDKRKRLLRKVARLCINDTDPVSLDVFVELDDAELQTIVAIGEDPKRKHCLTLDSAFGIWNQALKTQSAAKNPLNPDHLLSEKEIETIIKLKKKVDPSFKAPPKKARLPNSLKLKVIETTASFAGDEEVGGEGMRFGYVALTDRVPSTRIRYIHLGLGWIPLDVNTNKYTSNWLLDNINELWKQQKLLISHREPYSCCAIDLRRGRDYWQDANTRGSRFDSLCTQVASLLAAPAK